MTLEKRSFMIGFIIGKITAEEMPFPLWARNITKFCETFSMTVPTKVEMDELNKFLEYALNIADSKQK